MGESVNPCATLKRNNMHQEEDMPQVSVEARACNLSNSEEGYWEVPGLRPAQGKSD
jgi:hypothetical protein